MKKPFVLIFFLLIFSDVFAQNVLDGVFVKEHTPCKFVPYTYLRETEPVWAKRVRRVVSKHEKFNLPFFSSSTHQKSLWQIIAQTLQKEPEKLTLYIACSSDSTLKLTELFAHSLQLKNDSAKYISNIERHFVEWEIVEDWYFDRERSVLDVEIIGVSPRIAQLDASGNIINIKNICWFYYPQLRNIIQHHFTFPRNNDAQRTSFDDLFRKRMFFSVIKHETNIYESNEQQFLYKLKPDLRYWNGTCVTNSSTPVMDKWECAGEE